MENCGGGGGRNWVVILGKQFPQGCLEVDDVVKKSHFLGSELVSIRLSGLGTGDKGQNTEILVGAG